MADIVEIIAEAQRLSLERRFDEADRLYEGVLKSDPRHGEALLQHARLAVMGGRLVDAKRMLETILAAEPNHAPACQGMAVVSQRAGDLAQAAKWYAKIEQIDPSNAGAAYNSAVVQQQLGQLQQAEASLRRALALDAGFAPAANNLGSLLQQQGRHAEAESAYRQAIAAASALTDAYYNLGLLLQKQGRRAEAEQALQQVLRLAPNNPVVMTALGTLCQDARSYDAAIDWYQRALAIDPRGIEAQFNLGTALRDVEREREALAAFRSAYSLGLAAGLAQSRPIPIVFAGAYFEIGRLLRSQKEYEAWIVHYEACPQGLRDDVQFVQYGLEVAMHVGDFAAIRGRLAVLTERAQEICALGQAVRLLAIMQYLDLAQADLLRFYRRFAELADAHTQGLRLTPQVDAREGRRIRIGYLSPDFKVHVMGLLMYEVISRHDRARFEVFLYALNEQEDALSARFRAACDKYVVLDYPVSVDCARRIAADRLDVLIDLGGHMAGSRPLILAHRPAPVQLTHLGYHGALGLETVDFKLTDAYADLPDNAQYLIEDLLPMAGCLMPFCRRKPSPGGATRADLGMREDAIVFGVFINVLKLSERCLAAWKAILDHVEDSVLAFSPHYNWAREATLNYVAAAGIARERIVFVPSGDESDFGRWRYRLVDIVLDTFPYTGGDTTVAALDMGVPVVTLCGQRQSERVSYSILKNLGVEAGIAYDVAEYIDIACRLAQQPAERSALSAQILDRIEHSSIADMAAYARNLEAALLDAIAMRADTTR